METIDEVVEVFFDFSFEDDGFGESAVFEAAAFGSGFAFGGSSPARFGSVDTGGFDLFIAAHDCDWILAHGWWEQWGREGRKRLTYWCLWTRETL